MLTVFLALIVLVCFLLILVIMVQNPKGGGLSSSFGGSQQLGGVKQTSDFLDKSTWTLGAVLVALIIMSGLYFESSAPVQPQEEQTEAPAAPASAPATDAPAQQ